MTNKLTGDALKAEIERLRNMPCTTFPSDYEAGLWQIIDSLLAENERQARVIEGFRGHLQFIHSKVYCIDGNGQLDRAFIEETFAAIKEALAAIESESKPQTEG
jgi:hypothetical protein